MLYSLWFSWMLMLSSSLQIKGCNDISTLKIIKSVHCAVTSFSTSRMTFYEMFMMVCLILFADYSLIQEKYPSWTRASFIRRCLYQGQLGVSCFWWLCCTPSFSNDFHPLFFSRAVFCHILNFFELYAVLSLILLPPYWFCNSQITLSPMLCYLWFSLRLMLSCLSKIKQPIVF